MKGGKKRRAKVESSAAAIRHCSDKEIRLENDKKSFVWDVMTEQSHAMPRHLL